MMVGGDYGLGVPTSRRETQRAKQNKRDRKKQTPLQEQTPADVRVVILVLVCFLGALFLVTNLSLGL